ATGAREREVARTESRPELFGECEEPIVRAGDAKAQLVVIARAAQVQHRGTGGSEGLERELVQQARAERTAEDEQPRPDLGQAEDTATLGLRGRARTRRNRPAGDEVLRRVPAGDRERE